MQAKANPESTTRMKNDINNAGFVERGMRLWEFRGRIEVVWCMSNILAMLRRSVMRVEFCSCALIGATLWLKIAP